MEVKNTQGETCLSKVEWGEIDTTAPFESVKDAINLFGAVASREKVNIQKPQAFSGESPAAKESQLLKLQKELKTLKEQLKLSEATKSHALIELEEAKQVLEDLTKQLEASKESEEKAKEITEKATLRAAELQTLDVSKPEDSGEWEAEINEEIEKQKGVLEELDFAKQELRKLKYEISEAEKVKKTAICQAEAAKAAIETNSNLIEQIKSEIATTNESLSQVKLACITAEKERADILSEKLMKVDNDLAEISQSVTSVNASNKGYEVQDLETKLSDAQILVESFEKEIELAKESHASLAKAASVASDNLLSVQSEIDKIKQITPTADLDALVSELERAKASLLSTTHTESAFRVCMESLKAELEQVRNQVAELKEKEVHSEAAKTSLMKEISQKRTELISVSASEIKTKDAIADFSSSLKELFVEIGETKKDVINMREKALGVRAEADQAKSALNEAENKLLLVLKEAEAAKAAEKIAQGRLETVTRKINVAMDPSVQSGIEIVISKDEYDSLNRRVAEADQLADMKVGAALAQVEAVKAAEEEQVMKLEAANKEIEELRLAMEESLQKAEMAEKAKMAVEGELRRWREREQKKRAVLLAAAQEYTNNEKTNGLKLSEMRRDVGSRSTVVKARNSESLGRVLNINTICSPERVHRVHSVDRSFVFKKRLLPAFGNIFSKKKDVANGVKQQDSLAC